MEEGGFLDILKEHLRIEQYARELWEETRSNVRVDKVTKGRIAFIEGPPTMNGEPHIGHVRGRVIKDLYFRMEKLKGNSVRFKAGWDTQGLPVELQAEKELGISGNKNEMLQQIGVEALVGYCKSIIMKYNRSWLEADRLLGMSFDYDGAYWTYRDEYIEREWRIIRAAFEKGLLYEGYRVVAYCPSCQTSLSNTEVGLGYAQVDDPSLYYKVKLNGEDNYLVVWTTMPFTLVTDQMVGVNPSAEYVYVKVDNETGSETWVLASSMMDQVLSMLKLKGTVVSKVRGSELEGKAYEPPLADFVPEQAKGHANRFVVVAEDFVDVNTGTGLVHLSPANGEDDFAVAQRRKMDVFNPIDDQVRFTAEAGRYSGLFVRDADDMIANDLKKNGHLVRYGRINHTYPTCWRSGHKLVYLARREYFYSIERIKDQLVEAASSAAYFFEQPKNRFLEIIKEGKPWCISRERVWGTPMPIWVCKDCGNKVYAFDRRSIIAQAKALPDGENFELHRPWIDRVVLKCPACGGDCIREPFVLDTWHNSGAAPYASLTDTEYGKLIPAPFLTEAIDQTRGWAYTLLVENVILEGKAPFNSFLFSGHVVDENGEKMSKSKGNIIPALEILNRDPVDLVRFYLLWKSSPIDELNFSNKEMMGRPYQVLNTLRNLHAYYKINSSYDKYVWSPEHRTHLTDRERWLFTELDSFIRRYVKLYDERRFNEMMREIDYMVIEVLSQKYVPMTRGELWSDSPETAERRAAIYCALGSALHAIDVLLHPAAPFLTEYLFNSSLNVGKRGSLLQEGMPAIDRETDYGLIDRFQVVWAVVSASNNARMKAGIKRRWPIGRLLFYTNATVPPEDLELIKGLANVRDVQQVSDAPSMPMKRVVRVNRREVGRLFRERSAIVEAKLNVTDFGRMDPSKGVDIEVGSQTVHVPPEALDIGYEPLPDTSLVLEKDLILVLEVKRDAELIREGYVRDVARRIQYLRKEKGYNPTDVLPLARIAGLDEEMADMLRGSLDRLAFLVRVQRVEILMEPTDGIDWTEVDLDERKIHLSV